MNCTSGYVWSLLAAVLVAMTSAANAADPMDWPHWRGPEMNGISRETGIVDRWTTGGKNVLWENKDAGGRSTPIVMNGMLYTLVRDQPGTKFEGERILCLDAKTGKTEWERSFNVYLSDVPDTRVGWSSVTGDPETGHVFVLGVCGVFECFDGKTGRTIWKHSHSLSEEFGLLNTYGGRTNIPLVRGNLVIISGIVIGWGEMAKPCHRFIAFDKRNGQTVWFEGTRPLPFDTTYSSPILTAIGGQELMIFGSGDGGVHAFRPLTGQKVWTYNVSRRGINTTPLVIGDTVICGHSEENIDTTKMGALFAIDGTKSGDITKSGEKWRVPEWYVGKSSPLHVNGRIYAVEDGGTLLIVDAKTGKLVNSVKLRAASVRASPLFVDGKLFVVTTNGIWWTFKPTESGVDVVYRGRNSGGEFYASPIVSHGRLYAQTTEALYCIGSKGKKPAADKIPDPPKVALREEAAELVHAQLVPVELLLSPGEGGAHDKQEFQVRLYNQHGQFLRMAKTDEITMSIKGPGVMQKSEIQDGQGKKRVAWEYVTPDTPEHGAVIVTAKFRNLTGTARIRLVPKFAWNFDFSDGQVPVSWIGCRYRHIVIDYSLLTKLKGKNPLASQLYIAVMTAFTNSSNPQVTGGKAPHVYNDGTPRLTWTGLLRFLELLEKVKTLDQAKAALDPALKLLTDEKVIAKSEWSNPKGVGVQLAVTRGPRKVDGNGVMLKIKTIPKGARSRGWIGRTSSSNYTIQADVIAATKDGKMPSIGLIAQRYTLELQGTLQRLQIRTWPTQLRMAKTVDFKWQAEKWYTIKLSASVVTNGGKKQAVLKAKVWVRGEKEPAEWQVEAVDDRPNLTGSPGLYGDAMDAEIFYDNIKVTANKK